MAGLDELLELETELDPWRTTIEGLHPWAFIRTSILEELMKRERGFSEARPPDRKGPGPLTRARLHLGTLGHLVARSHPRPEVLFFTPGTVRVPVEGKAASQNRLYDDYYRSFETPLIFERGYPTAGMEPEVHRDRILMEDTLQYLVRLKARLGGLPTEQRTRARHFADEVARGFELDDRRAWIEQITLMHLRWALHRGHLDRLVDTEVTTGLAFVHSASYMKWYGILTRWLHERGLTVVEVQHGYVSSHHPAYNHPAPCLKDPDHPCRRYLPDHLLVFGSHWAEQIRVPARVHVVGYPHLDRLCQVRQREAKARPEEVLIISQGYVTESLVEVAQALSRAFPRRAIHFKLHPGEVEYRERYAPLDQCPNVTVNRGGDIHRLIASCGIIVGYFSTALFEAVRFEDKRIFFLRNDLVPGELGHGFDTPQQLVRAIGEEGSGRSRIQVDELWHPHWNKAFNKFMAGVRPR